MAEHPLALELTRLRTSLANCQQEAHAAAAQVQRYSLETTAYSEKTRFLARENAALREELAKLRQTPDTTPDRSALQLTELTLALRRMGDKLDLSEGQVLERTTELGAVKAERTKLGLEIQAMAEELSNLRSKEEEYKKREREAETRCKTVEAEKGVVERVIQEYADLVRSLEARLPAAEVVPLPGPTRKPKHDLEVGKSNIANLAQEFNGESERLHREIARLEDELRDVRFQLAAERKVAEEERGTLAAARSDLAKHLNDDNTASKLVSRYMRFSQSSSNDLQTALEALKTRHAATLATFSLQLSNATSLLGEERKTTGKLRVVLDELIEDVAREAYGRRREISLRLALLGREERTAEALARWVRRATERKEKDTPDPQHRALDEAKELLEIINGHNGGPKGLPNGHAEAFAEDGATSRILLAEDAVNIMTHQLTSETDRRLLLQQRLVSLIGSTSPPPTPAKTRPVSSKNVRSPKADNGSGGALLFSPNEKASHRPSDATSDVFNSQPLALPLVEEQQPSKSTLIIEPTSVQPPVEQPLPSAPSAPPPPEVKPEDTAVATDSYQPPTLPDLPSPTTESETVSEQPTEPEPTLPAPVEVPNTNAVITPEEPTSAPAPPSPVQPSSSIIADLARAPHRYDDLQRSFRDCHLTLSQLKSELAASAQSSTNSKPSSSIFFPSAKASSFKTVLLQTAVSRLDDFNEDARVELEIRIADDARLAKGYETLLALPTMGGENHEREELEAEMQAFIDGTSSTTVKAIESFQRKRDDLLHDIARVKLALHASSTDTEDSGIIDQEQEQGQSMPGDFGGTAGDKAPPSDPYATLGLRIAMPAPKQSSLGFGRPVTDAGSPRSRKTSAGMFALGLLGGGGDGSPRTRAVSLMGSRMRRVSSVPLMESNKEGEDVE